jgi:DNA/RNA-binding domain of Phe-tRNA-synthetase-like protein
MGTLNKISKQRASMTPLLTRIQKGNVLDRSDSVKGLMEMGRQLTGGGGAI